MKKIIGLLVVIGLAVAGYFLVNKIPSGKRPFEMSILNYVPDNAVSFTACNSGIAKLKKYWSSEAFVKAGDLLRQPERLTKLFTVIAGDNDPQEIEKTAKKIAAISSAILDSDLMNLAFDIEEYVHYQTTASDAKSENPLYPQQAAFINLNNVYNYDKIFDDLTAKGLKFSKEQYEGINYYSFDYMEILSALSIVTDPAVISAMPSMKMYFAGKEKKFVMATSKEITPKFFKGEANASKPKIFENESFKDSIKNSDFNAKRDFCEGYIDFATMIANSLAASLNNEDATGIKSEDLSKSVPLISAIQSVGLDNSLYMFQRWRLNQAAIPEEFKKWVDAMQVSTTNNGLKVIPATSSLAFSVNGEFINKLLVLAEGYIGDNEKQKYLEFVDLAKGVEYLSIGMLPSSSNSWPEAVYASAHKDVQKYISKLKEELASGIEAQMPGFEWKQKKIAGSDVSYFLTPLGVGTFIGSKNDVMIASTTESTLTKLAESVDNKSLGLGAYLEKMDVDDSKPNVLNLYVDFPLLLNIANDARNSFAMFAPQLPIMPEDLPILVGALGRTYLSTSIKGADIDVIVRHSVAK